MSDFIADTWLRIFEPDGPTSIAAHEEPRVNAAVSRYVDSGCSHDTLLDLEMIFGDTYYTKASLINSWYISTPAFRRAEIQHQGAYEEEDKSFKAELGIWSEDG